jgi:hypothetical protein
MAAVASPAFRHTPHGLEVRPRRCGQLIAPAWPRTDDGQPERVHQLRKHRSPQPQCVNLSPEIRIVGGVGWRVDAERCEMGCNLPHAASMLWMPVAASRGSPRRRRRAPISVGGWGLDRAADRPCCGQSRVAWLPPPGRPAGDALHLVRVDRSRTALVFPVSLRHGDALPLPLEHRGPDQRVAVEGSVIPFPGTGFLASGGSCRRAVNSPPVSMLGLGQAAVDPVTPAR